jgi:hypothetical protein
MDVCAAVDRESNDPVTLHRIMRTMIGEELKARYEPPQKLSHALFVLLLQLKEKERGQKRITHTVPAGAGSSDAASA